MGKFSRSKNEENVSLKFQDLEFKLDGKSYREGRINISRVVYRNSFVN